MRKLCVVCKQKKAQGKVKTPRGKRRVCSECLGAMVVMLERFERTGEKPLKLKRILDVLGYELTSAK